MRGQVKGTKERDGGWGNRRRALGMGTGEGQGKGAHGGWEKGTVGLGFGVSRWERRQ